MCVRVCVYGRGRDRHTRTGKEAAGEKERESRRCRSSRLAPSLHRCPVRHAHTGLQHQDASLLVFFTLTAIAIVIAIVIVLGRVSYVRY